MVHTRGSPYSVGFDLATAEDAVVPAGRLAILRTDLSISCPEGMCTSIAPRRCEITALSYCCWTIYYNV